jgi:hypothetical protein
VESTKITRKRSSGLGIWRRKWATDWATLEPTPTAAHDWLREMIKRMTQW